MQRHVERDAAIVAAGIDDAEIKRGPSLDCDRIVVDGDGVGLPDE